MTTNSSGPSAISNQTNFSGLFAFEFVEPNIVPTPEVTTTSSSSTGELTKSSCNSKIAAIFGKYAASKDCVIDMSFYHHIQSCLDEPHNEETIPPTAELLKYSRAELIALLNKADIFSSKYDTLVEALHTKKKKMGVEPIYLYDLPIDLQRRLSSALWSRMVPEGIKHIFERPVYDKTITVNQISMSALTFAFTYCSTEMAEAFAWAGANVDEAAWNYAPLENKFIIIKYTCRHIDRLRVRSIDFYYDAVNANRVDLVRELLNLGRVRVDTESLEPSSPFFSKKPNAISIALEKGYDDMVDLLVERGATIPPGQSLLEIAAHRGRHRRVEALLNSQKYSQEEIQNVVSQIKPDSMFQKFVSWWESKEYDPQRNPQRTLSLLTDRLDQTSIDKQES